jgi:protein N-terminal glutamine amidohydrolase
VFPFIREELDYQPYYCEENVLRLLSRPELAAWDSWAVLVSSRRRDVVLLRQRAGRPVDGLVHWDYHVFAVALDPVGGAVVLDIDSDLPFPCPFGRYVEDGFPPDAPAEAAARFRAVSAAEYVRGLSSDRSHMRRDDGGWIWPPPPWPAPGEEEGRAPNLMRWIDMRRRSPGRLFDARGLSSFVRARERKSLRRMV